MIDWSFNVGVLVVIVGQIGSIVAFIYSVKGEIAKVSDRLTYITEDFTDLKIELKELRKVVTTQVDHDGRITRAEEDIREIRTDIKELRHGEGFIFPLKPVG